MTGSKNFVADDNFLLMQLTRNKTGAKYLKITLGVMDTYTVTFSKIVKNSVVIVKELENVYNDMLADIFTEVTGLYTHL